MKYGIVSDIHSNIHAYSYALNILDKFVDEIICLGDIVGYNANPKECISVTRSHPKIKYVIKGNHDEHACNGLRFSGARGLSRDAYDGLVYTINNIDDSDIEWLDGLSEYVVINGKNTNSVPFACVHGSTSLYDKYGYMLNQYDAYIGSKRLVERFGVNICFFGHTHYPTFYRRIEDAPNGLSEFYIGKMIFEEEICSKTYELSDENSVYLINPGSIGQARTYGICSFAVFDSETRRLHFERLQYDNLAAVKAVKDAGYSDTIAERLKG